MDERRSEQEGGGDSPAKRGEEAGADVQRQSGSNKRPRAADDGAGNIKETIESILVAFVLAFIFRAFVVEAFVIPTGSMAPTLMGAHLHFTCPDCGYQWDANYKLPEGSDDDINVPNFAWEYDGHGRIAADTLGHPLGKEYRLNCPNCGLDLDVGKQKPVPVQYGDRILVLKYLYMLHEPERWDVVVFKSPDRPPRRDQTKYDYSTNYIKRLVGRPGESLMILDGDIYVSSGEDGKPDSQKTWQIQTKPRYAQEAMWRSVYNNDFHPMGQVPRTQPWRQPWQQTAGKGWETGGDGPSGHTFAFTNATGSGRLNFDVRANPSMNALMDYVSYNQSDGDGGSFTPVSDLKLDFWYQRTSGDGPLRCDLTKRGHHFIAEINPTDVRLVHRLPDGGEVLIGTAPIDGEARGRAMHVEFQNVDYRVSVRIDDRDRIVTTDQQYAPDVRTLIDEQGAGATIPSVSLDAEKQSCEVKHIALYRDVYYTFARNGLMNWGGPYDLPAGQGGPVHLGPDEYFVCGDNSPQSWDARFWPHHLDPQLLIDEDLDVQAGRVPRRFMLGKAFFVYWPAGFRPFGDGSWAIVPNFGEMRFIH